MTRPLVVVPLTWEHCEALAPRITDADSRECLALGRSPLQALAGGCMMGEGFCALRDSDLSPAGAFGWTRSQTIWSLWARLSTREAAQVIRDTPDWVHGMVKRSGFDHLFNFASADNKVVLRWLRSSGAFCVEPLPRDGSVYFETWPLRVLQKMVS